MYNELDGQLQIALGQVHRQIWILAQFFTALFGRPALVTQG